MFPKSTVIPNKFIAKEKFYGHGDFTAKTKTSMTNDVAKVMVSNQLSAKTLNITVGKVFPEIMVLRVVLKNKAFDLKVLDIMDKSIRAAFVLFVLEYEDQLCASIAYKDKNGDNITISKRWTSNWSKELDLSVEGRTVDAVYENLIQQVSGGQLKASADKTLKEKVVDTIMSEKIQRQIDQLEQKMNNEPQLKKKLELKAQIKQLKEQL